MKKLLLIIAALFIMTGCGQSGEYTLSEDEYERLIQLDGPMFTYGHYSNGLVSGMEDYWSGSGFTVYYDGTIEGFTSYNISGTFTDTATLEKEDYITIYEFCRNWMQSDMNGAYDYGGCEQDSYGFYFYDEEGERNCLYYTDHVEDEKLNSIIDIYKKFDMHIEVVRAFNLYDYMDPYAPDAFLIDYARVESSGNKFKCHFTGSMMFCAEYCEGLDWYIYILPEEPTEELIAETEPYIFETTPDISMEEAIPVKEGDWVYVYPDYHGEGEPKGQFGGYFIEWDN